MFAILIAALVAAFASIANAPPTQHVSVANSRASKVDVDQLREVYETPICKHPFPLPLGTAQHKQFTRPSLLILQAPTVSRTTTRVAPASIRHACYAVRSRPFFVLDRWTRTRDLVQYRFHAAAAVGAIFRRRVARIVSRRGHF